MLAVICFTGHCELLGRKITILLPGIACQCMHLTCGFVYYKQKDKLIGEKCDDKTDWRSICTGKNEDMHCKIRMSKCL